MVYMQSGETQQSMPTSEPLIKKHDTTHNKTHDTTHSKTHDTTHSKKHETSHDTSHIEKHDTSCCTTLVPSLVVGVICFALMGVGLTMVSLGETVQVTLTAVGCLGIAFSLVYAYMSGGCDCLCST